MNDCFLVENQLLGGAAVLAKIPGVIIQGRYDLVCPPSSADELAAAWPAARLAVVGAAGHSASEPGITDALVRATDAFRR